MRTDGAALDFVELVPVVDAPTPHRGTRNALLTAGPALGGVVEHRGRSVVMARRVGVLLRLVPFVAAVVCAANHARVILFHFLRTRRRSSFGRFGQRNVPSWNVIVTLFSHTSPIISSSYTAFPLANLSNGKRPTTHSKS